MAWLVTWPGSLALRETVFGHQYEVGGDADTPGSGSTWEDWCALINPEQLDKIIVLNG